MSAQENLVGGWTAYHGLSPEDVKVFNAALAGIVGVVYTPELVSKQIVSGVNYRFQTNASLPGQSHSWQAIVEIYAPLNGEPHVTQIIRV